MYSISYCICTVLLHSANKPRNQKKKKIQTRFFYHPHSVIWPHYYHWLKQSVRFNQTRFSG